LNWWKVDGTNTLLALTAAIISILDGTPTTYEEATTGPESDYWKDAMDEEMVNIKKQGTYVPKQLPNGEGAIGCRWVFKKKLNSEPGEEHIMKNIPYKSILGQALYIAITVRPDIATAVSTEHWKALLQILKYLQGTRKLGLTLGNNSSKTITLSAIADILPYPAFSKHRTALRLSESR
jgi:hypothetical protein